MDRKYTLLAILLIVLALGLVILPKNKEQKEIDPKALLSAITEKSRYLSVDEVTHRIIGNDPTLLLIDLRQTSDFGKFALPGAINVPVDSLLSKSVQEMLIMPGKDKILISNADLVSEKAWLIASRLSVKRIYIMKGGMNEWFSTIIQEKLVNSAASSNELDLVSFRKAAKQYFTGSGEMPVEIPKPKEKVQVIRKAPEATSGGGC